MFISYSAKGLCLFINQNLRDFNQNIILCFIHLYHIIYMACRCEIINHFTSTIYLEEINSLK